MRLPSLGARGEGWVVAQSVIFVAIAVAGIRGQRWSAAGSPPRLVAGITIGIAGQVLFVAGLIGLGSSLTPFPEPLEGSSLRTVGVYRFVRHPIYGGALLIALGCSLVSSPHALFATLLLVVLFELKARHEESLLTMHFPEYEAYQRRVRWRFIPGVH
jgi:protein-S-isoprenylcysteine O-methyltransferase Ste14